MTPEQQKKINEIMDGMTALGKELTKLSNIADYHTASRLSLAIDHLDTAKTHIALVRDSI